MEKLISGKITLGTIDEFLYDDICSHDTENGIIECLDSDEGGCVRIVELEGRSEQVQTVQGKNLCPSLEYWTLTGGAYLENGWIVLPNLDSYASVNIEWNKRGTPLYWGGIFSSNETNGAAYLNIYYLDESGILLSGNGWAQPYGASEYNASSAMGFANDEYTEALSKAATVQINILRSGEYAPAPYKFKDIFASNVDVAYELFIPTSPSPQYPSEIHSVGDDGQLRIVSSKYPRNLVLNSKINETSSLYGFAVRNLSIQLEAGKTYCFTMNGHVDQQAINDGKSLATFIHEENWTVSSTVVGTQMLTDTSPYAKFSCLMSGNYVVTSYLYPNEGSRLGKATVNWVTVVEGNKPLLDWVPAPEDITSDNEAQFQDLISTATIPLTKPLRSLPNGTHDTLECKDGIWGITRNIGKEIWNGSESWIKWGSSPQPGYFVAYHQIGFNAKNFLCSHFVDTSYTADTVGLNWHLTPPHITVRSSTANSINEFKTWLSANNVTVVYTLNTPTWEPLDAPSNKALNNLLSYSPNNFIYTADSLATNFSVAQKSRAFYDNFKLQEEIKNTNSSLTDLDDELKSSFYDGIINTNEAEAIRKSAETMHVQVTNQCGQINLNPFLVGTPKTNLQIKYNDCSNAYTVLMVAINTAVEYCSVESTKTDAQKKTSVSDMNTAFSTYKTKLAVYQRAYQDAIDAIAGKKAGDAAKDAVDGLDIGGRNLLLNSGNIITQTIDYFLVAYKTSTLKPNTKYTFVINGFTNIGNHLGIWFNDGNGQPYLFPSVDTPTTQYATITTPETLISTNIHIFNYRQDTAKNATVNWACMYEGEIKPPIDWTPAPEDIYDNIESVSATLSKSISDVSTIVDKDHKSITDKIWETDITTTIENLNVGGINLWDINQIKRYSGGTLSTIVSGTTVNPKSGTITLTSNPADIPGCVINTVINSSIKEFVISGYFDRTDTDNDKYSNVKLYYKCFDSSNTQVQEQVDTTLSIDKNSTIFVTTLDVPSNTAYINLGIGQYPYVKPYTLTGIMIKDSALYDITKDIRDRIAQTVKDIDSITSKVSSAEANISKKADGSTVTALSEKVSLNELSLNGFKTTVSETYTTKNDSSKSDTLNQALALMSTGELVYTDPTFINGTNNVIVYNNFENGNVIVERIAKLDDCPTKSGYCLQIKSIGLGNPGLGGFYQNVQSRANAKFIIKYLIKLPVNYYLNVASNQMGAGYTDKFITPTDGTGKWEIYVRETICGTSAPFHNGGHVYIGGSTPTPTSPLIWYLGAIYCVDVTNASTVQEQITSVKTEAEQLADKFTWVVKSGTNESNMQLTDRALDVVADHINLNGLVTFSGLNKTAKDKIEEAKKAGTDAQSNIDKLEFGGRNYFKKSTSIDIYNVTTILDKDHPDCPNGFYTAGAEGRGGTWRLNNVITSAGKWTISFEVRGSQNCQIDFWIDFCDGGVTYFQTTADNTWSKIELTVNVLNYSHDVYNFVDFQNLAWAYYYFRNIKVEKGNKATDWTPAPEDIDSAINETASNTVLTPADKIGFLNTYRTIIDENAKLTSTATSAGLKTTDTVYSAYTTKYTALYNILNGLVGDTTKQNATTTGFNKSGYDTSFSDYTTAKKNFEIGIAEKIKSLITNVGNVAIDNASVIGNWCYDNDKSIINGGVIASGTIIAKLIAAGAITADKIATDAIKSRNYVLNSAGTFFNLADGTLDSKNFKIAANGNVTLTGSITASTGYIGGTLGFTITSGAIYRGNSAFGQSGNGNIYLGVNGFSLSDKFKFDSAGNLIINANTLNISGNTVATQNSVNAKADKQIPDTRNTNENPQWYFTNYPRQVITEFKLGSALTVPSTSTYGTLETKVPWSESSGGYPVQIFRNGDGTFERYGTSATAWSGWKTIENTADAQNKATAAKSDAIAASKEYTNTGLANKLDSAWVTQANIFNKLTNNGTTQGLYMTPGDSKIYINAEYIKSGFLDAKYITAGILKDAGENFKLELATGKLTAKKLSIESTNFSLTEAGVITAKSGNIGGWTITDGNMFKQYTDSNNVDHWMYFDTGTSNPNYAAMMLRTKAHTATTWDDQFQITWNGRLIAKNADIKGTIDATDIRIRNSIIMYANDYVGQFSILDYIPSGINQGLSLASPGQLRISASGSQISIYDITDFKVPIREQGTPLSSKYQAKGSYAAASHTHTPAQCGAASVSHTHSGLYYGTTLWVTAGDGTFRPAKNMDNKLACGNGSYRWTRVYATNTAISTSDKYDKSNIVEIDERYERLFMDLKPVNYRWKNFNENDSHDRVHCGLISQEVEEAAYKNGLSEELFAAICKDRLERPTTDGRLERYGLAYGELHGLEIHMIQKIIKENLELKKRLEKLEALLITN